MISTKRLCLLASLSLALAACGGNATSRGPEPEPADGTGGAEADAAAPPKGGVGGSGGIAGGTGGGSGGTGGTPTTGVDAGPKPTGGTGGTIAMDGGAADKPGAAPDAGAPKDAAPPKGDGGGSPNGYNNPNAHWKILPLGDSITETKDGYRGPLYNLLVGAGYDVDFVGSNKVAPTLGGDPDCEGHGGHTIGPDMSQYCMWNATTKKHDCNAYHFNLWDNLDSFTKADANVILLLVGINDLTPVTSLKDGESGIIRPTNPAETPAKLEALVNELKRRKPQAKIVVASLLKLKLGDPSTMPPVNAKAKELGEASPDDNVYFVDMHALTLAQGDYADIVHPNVSGGEKMAKVWYDGITPILGKPDKVVKVPDYKEDFATKPANWTFSDANVTVDGKLKISNFTGISRAVFDGMSFTGNYTLTLRLMHFSDGSGNKSRLLFNRGDDGSQYFVEFGGGATVKPVLGKKSGGATSTLATAAEPYKVSGKYVTITIKVAAGAITVVVSKDGVDTTLFDGVKDASLTGGKLGVEAEYNYLEVDDITVTKD